MTVPMIPFLIKGLSSQSSSNSMDDLNSPTRKDNDDRRDYSGSNGVDHHVEGCDTDEAENDVPLDHDNHMISISTATTTIPHRRVTKCQQFYAEHCIYLPAVRIRLVV
jgi:hypothetical protein